LLRQEETTKNASNLNHTTRPFISLISVLVIISFISPYISRKAYALDIPQPIYPLNNSETTPDSDPPLGIPLFSWNPVSGATVYRLQVDNESSFSQPIFLDITTQSNSFIPQYPDQLLSDGDWYWRVRVDDPAPGGNWSPVHHFKKAWANQNNIPILLKPDEGESLAFFDSPVFSWTTITGATKYRLQFSASSDGFNSPIFSMDTLSTTYQPDERFPNSLYYWRVIPLDIAGHLGTPSSPKSFIEAYGSGSLENMVPQLLGPEDEASIAFTPTFLWTAIKGAERYTLEYTANYNCDFGSSSSIVTRQTSFTPTDTLQDANRYCWRVRAETDPVVGDWSATWHFKKYWNLKPKLLTPTYLYQTGLYPLYSWTPVPGAAGYHIEISKNLNFNPVFEESITSNTTYTPQTVYEGTAHYYWRVTPIDGGGKQGKTSEVGEFESIFNSLAPILIYPQYYYPPDQFGNFVMNPHEDQTVALPIFIWHRVMKPSPVGGTYATAYRIQVDDSQYFDSINWQYDTENTSASPTLDASFNPEPYTDYYWRVCPLTSLFGGDCIVNQDSGLPWWSQVWRARFNESLKLAPSIGNVPKLLRPTTGQESVEATPLLEWWPMDGATQYQVEVSRDADFTNIEISEIVTIPSFSPRTSLAQRSLERTDYGTFYWRVKGLTTNGWSDWSEVWRFQIASQTEWCYSRSLSFLDNRIIVGDDPTADAPLSFDLSSLYVSQSNTAWFFGFDATLTNSDLTYILYLDADNIDGSGATFPPERDYHIQTNSEHQPEYAVYVDVIAGEIDTQNIWLFAWDIDAWDAGLRFSDIGGDAYFNPGYVELEIPNSLIGMDENTSSVSLALFSVDNSSGELKDSVPSDPTVPGPALVTRFSAVSERMNLVYPPSTISGDPSIFHSIGPFFWDWPTGSKDGSDSTAPFAGSLLQVDMDPGYSLPHEATFQINSNTSYFSQNNITLLNDIVGDGIYYWRVRPRYVSAGNPVVYGAWANGWSFQRSGLVPANLHTSTLSSIISFGWDLAEGAETYRLQVATDPGFSDIVIDIFTTNNSFTPEITLPENNYYWRVQIIKIGGISGGWAEGEPFEHNLPVPIDLSPSNNAMIQNTPTYCWTPAILYDNSDNAVFSAWKYHIQVSTDPSFSQIYDAAETTNHCWTPVTGYPDGTYYWQVSVIDGSGIRGNYSFAAEFTKVYPPSKIINPKFGVYNFTPIFTWLPVDGAATYVFESSHYPTFIPLNDSIETINTQYSPRVNYEENRYYYWRIAIKDINGNQGRFVSDKFIIGTVYLAFMPQIRR
jgi:hypothetical protein